jgi:polyisoprenoid-binding protein YceI
MKSLNIRTVERARSGILVLIAMVAVISPVAFAEGSTWSLDSAASSVRLFQGSAANPDSVNTGVARVTGKVILDANDLDNSVFDLSIYPADENWASALSPEGSLPTGFVPNATDHILLRFKSTRILTTGNGKLKVIGDLTLTLVERSVTADANEAYAGPVYGDPVIRTKTREVTFLFPNLSVALSSGTLTAVGLRKKDALGLSGSARVAHEDFPEVLSAIQDTNWPSVVRNEHCQAAYEGGGEGYSGPVCTGTLIAATRADNCQMPSSVGGEDYSGAICTPPAGNQTTIVLDLKLVPTDSEPPAEMRSANATVR